MKSTGLSGIGKARFFYSTSKLLASIIPTMKVRIAAAILLAALLAALGCSGGEESAESEKERAKERLSEQAFLERLARTPASPPEYVGPEPKWWLCDSPPAFVGPEPGWRPEPPVPPGQTAAEKSTALEKKVAKTAPAPAPKPVRTKSPAKNAVEVEREFQDFCERFLEKMARNLRHTAMNKEVLKTGNGYLARFIHLEKDSMTVDVKPCEGPASYVGVMRYLEGHYENECGTADCAKEGPFVLVKKVRTTEIFRYAGGRWRE